VPCKANPSIPPLRPRAGVRLDRDRLDFELGVRGLTARDLSAAIGLSEVAISRARCGHPVTPRTLRRIAAGLTSIPQLDGAAELLVTPS
jgi:transcriptional regulator with XRE-family HTH domain